MRGIFHYQLPCSVKRRAPLTDSRSGDVESFDGTQLNGLKQLTFIVHVSPRL